LLDEALGVDELGVQAPVIGDGKEAAYLCRGGDHAGRFREVHCHGLLT
jgi:hypothetical protein